MWEGMGTVHVPGSGEALARQGETSRGPVLATRARYPNTLSLKARQTTAFWWPLYSLLISPVSTHHSLARLSEEAATESEKKRGIYIYIYYLLRLFFTITIRNIFLLLHSAILRTGDDQQGRAAQCISLYVGFNSFGEQRVWKLPQVCLRD